MVFELMCVSVSSDGGAEVFTRVPHSVANLAFFSHQMPRIMERLLSKGLVLLRQLSKVCSLLIDRHALRAQPVQRSKCALAQLPGLHENLGESISHLLAEKLTQMSFELS